MADHALTEQGSENVPALPPDSENEALLDAEKTFKITVLGSILFVAAALFIIMSTRMAG